MEEVDLVITLTQMPHKYSTIHNKWLKKVYNNVGPALISAHYQPTLIECTHHQYINMLANYIIDDETGNLLEYRHLIKRKKAKK